MPQNHPHDDWCEPGGSGPYLSVRSPCTLSLFPSRRGVSSGVGALLRPRRLRSSGSDAEAVMKSMPLRAVWGFLTTCATTGDRMKEDDDALRVGLLQPELESILITRTNTVHSRAASSTHEGLHP